MRVAVIAAALLFGGQAGAAEVMVVGDGPPRTARDPFALIDASGPVGTLVAPDVGLIVEPAAGASPSAAALLVGAFARRFGGHVPVSEVLAAGRIFTIRAALSPAPGGATNFDWSLRDEQGGEVGAVFATRRLAGEMTPLDAEIVAFQAAALMRDAPEIRAALDFAGGAAALDRTPAPASRPVSEEEEPSAPRVIRAERPPGAATAPVPRPEVETLSPRPEVETLSPRPEVETLSPRPEVASPGARPAAAETVRTSP